MAQQVKVIASKPNTLSSILRIYTEERELILHSFHLTFTCVLLACLHVCMCAQAHIKLKRYYIYQDIIFRFYSFLCFMTSFALKIF